jgi:hypothetical protein
MEKGIALFCFILTLVMVWCVSAAGEVFVCSGVTDVVSFQGCVPSGDGVTEGGWLCWPVGVVAGYLSFCSGLLQR